MLHEPEYPGFTKARELWKEDPNCTACGRHVDAPNSLTGVMCRYCFTIWYDAAPPDGSERWNSQTLGDECRRREVAKEYPFDKPMKTGLFG